MVGVGVYFASKNKNTDDYFRGGQQIAWWAAGCSIFATMLSSITYMAIPAKAFAQDMVYLLGNLMISGGGADRRLSGPALLPPDRRHQRLRISGEAVQPAGAAVRQRSFTLFHIFRMGIVMSLAAWPWRRSRR